MSQQSIIRVYDAAIDDVNKDDMSLVVKANTASVDYYRTVLLTGGIRLASYEKLNKPVLWEHGKDINRRFTDPIANCRWIRNNGGPFPNVILAKPRFLRDDFARQRFEWYRDGVIKGWSINLLPDPDASGPPTQAELRAHPDWEAAETVYRAGTLIELSGTVLPGNPDCLSGERAMKVMDLVNRNLLHLTPEAEPVYRDAIARTSLSVPIELPRATTDSEGGLAAGGATVRPDDAPAAEGERFLPADPGAVSASAPGEARAADAGGDGESHAITREPDGWYAHCDRCLGGPYPTAERAAAHSCGEILRDDMGEMADDGGGMAMDMGMGDMPATGAARSSEGEHRPGPHKPTHGVKKRGKKWVVVANSGRLMGEYASKEEAENRVREIEYFKHEGRSAPDAGPAAADDLAAQLERLRSGAVPTLSDVMRLEMLRFRNWGADRDDAIRAERDLRDRGIV